MRAQLAAVERVSRAVWSVVAENGIEATSIRAVAERADCTTGLIMHHFGTRVAMLCHARHLLFGRATARANAAESSVMNPGPRLAAVLCCVLPIDEDRREETRVWSGFAAATVAYPELRTAHIASSRDWLLRITRLVSDVVPHASPTEARAAAGRLAAVAEGLAVSAMLDPETYPADRLTEIVTEEVVDVARRLRAATTDVGAQA